MTTMPFAHYDEHEAEPGDRPLPTVEEPVVDLLADLEASVTKVREARAARGRRPRKCPACQAWHRSPACSS